MNDSVYLNRKAFKKGLRDTLMLKPLRNLAEAIVHNERLAPAKFGAGGKSIVVFRDSKTGAIHVRKAS